MSQTMILEARKLIGVVDELDRIRKSVEVGAMAIQASSAEQGDIDAISAHLWVVVEKITAVSEEIYSKWRQAEAPESVTGK